MRVLVTYGKNPKTLAVVRSLGRAGHVVHVTDDSRNTISSYSKHCDGFFRTVSPTRRPREFVDSLIDYAIKNRIDLIIPMDDPECDALTDSADTLPEGLKVAMPDHHAYTVARDKWETVLLARSCGVPVPHSELVTSTGLISKGRGPLGTPFIMKPVRGSGSRGILLVRDSEDEKRIEQTITRFGPMIAQEFIPRKESIGVSCLANHGEIRAMFTHRRILEFPESGGPSLIRESIRNAKAEEYARRLVGELKWHGVVMVEFRVDDRTGEPVLMEMNPRFWGSLPLAIHCGVDFPALLCDMYDKGDVAEKLEYPIGRECVRLIPNGVASILSRGGTRRMASIARHSFRSMRFDVESVEDPWPTIGGIISLMEASADKSSYAKFYERGN